MSTSRPTPSRVREIAAIALTLAIPAALIATTWEPLEPPPRRAGRASVIEQEQENDALISAPVDQGDEGAGRARRGRKAREREQRTPPAAATPRPERTEP